MQTNFLAVLHVLRDFHVDDMVTGADIINEALTQRDIKVLCLDAFELGKWVSSCSDLLADIKDDSSVTIDNGLESSVLSIYWNQFQDTYHFITNPIMIPQWFPNKPYSLKFPDFLILSGC